MAAGRVDAFYERGLNAWDLAAGQLLVEEAGGEVLALAGTPPGVIAAANPELLQQLAELVGEGGPAGDPQGRSPTGST